MVNTISQGAKHAEPFVKDFCSNDNASFWNVIGNGQYLTEVQSYKLWINVNKVDRKKRRNFKFSQTTPPFR